MSLPVELFLALRYMRPRRTFVSVITVLSVLGVTLGVMVLIVVLSVMEGFEQRLSEKVIGFNAHIVVQSPDFVPNADALAAKIQKDHPGEVLAASPYVSGPVLCQFANRITPQVIKGIPLEGEDAVLPLRHEIISGEYELRGQTILVGEEWAKRYMALPGDKVLLFGPVHMSSFMRSREGGKAPKTIVLPSEYLITGIFRTGHFEYDMNYFITSLQNAQDLYNIGDNVHGINIRVRDPMQVTPLAMKLNKELKRPLVARTWMELNYTLFTAIATERTVMSFILFFIVIVAAFGLCSTLITITVQKSREIGALKAMGARDGQVLLLFAWHGLIVGMLGSLLGVSTGLLALHYRNPFRDLLDRRFHISVFPADIYNFTDIPSVTHPTSVAVIALAAIVICVVAALIPAGAAAKLQPARALRYE